MDGSRPGRPTLRSRLLLAGILALGLGSVPPGAAAAAKLRISDQLSPLDRQRPLRERTDFVVLHTTEGGDRSSLARIRHGGLAHYVVMTDGRVRRVISRQRVARHAGLSMWDGVRDLDQVSIGIEVVGYHNRPLTERQIEALRELLRQLKSIYKVSDERILCHSMIAYGNRNRWHRHAHRGRKRCGMQFAQPELRARLGLLSRPAFDPDVAAGRLVNADPHLVTVLFGPTGEAERVAASRFTGPDANVITAERTAWFIARDEFDQPSTIYEFPDGSRRRGHEVADWSRLPAGTRVLLGQDPPIETAWRVLGRDGYTAGEIAGSAYAAATTLYVRPDGRVLRGDQLRESDFRRLPNGTRVFLGFHYAGQVSTGRTAYQLCGPRYRNETTLYLLPGGAVRTGAQIREDRIPGGTLVLVAA
ncbi:MAG: N-acetylmuramoyl-L-alanine amidase [Candidatus Krumholzibacteria bacterium]|nr:N-acetylmuramoyl-L-alanine amidase [Candidatus Krumholzibacteria bacterium]